MRLLQRCGELIAVGGHHTVVVVGYDAARERWIIDNPALGPPGIQIYSLRTLDKLWHSRWYSRKSPGTSRPIILTH